jgi:hypothetical protein
MPWYDIIESICSIACAPCAESNGQLPVGRS